MIFVSYYTGDNYKICSNRLIPSLKKFNLPYDIKEIDDTGDYLNNISMKPEFVKYKLLQYRTSICWLDVDTEIVKYPYLLMDKDSDNINLQIYNWYADSNNHITRNNYNSIDKNKLLSSSGVFSVNYSNESLSLLDAWIKELNKNKNQIDDQTLDKVFNEGKWIDKLKYRWLPKEYNRMTWYSDWMNVQPIINHTKSNVCSI